MKARAPLPDMNHGKHKGTIESHIKIKLIREVLSVCMYGVLQVNSFYINNFLINRRSKTYLLSVTIKMAKRTKGLQAEQQTTEPNEEKTNTKGESERE